MQTYFRIYDSKQCPDLKRYQLKHNTTNLSNYPLKKNVYKLKDLNQNFLLTNEICSKVVCAVLYKAIILNMIYKHMSLYNMFHVSICDFVTFILYVHVHV